MLLHVIVLLLLLSSNAIATTYYVDFYGGSDANNGTNTSTPFKHSPGDCSSGNCNITLQPGDIVIFKGGVVYTGGITVNNSGISGSTIVFDGDSGVYAEKWGTEKAIIDGDSTFINFSVGNRSYITINGFELRNGKNSGNKDSIDTALVYGGELSSNVVVSNNLMHDVGHKTTDPDYAGNCIGTNSASNWDIHDNIMYNCFKSAIYIWPVSGQHDNLKIYNNTITDIVGWAIAAPIAFSTDSSSWEIYNNTIYDIKYYSQNNWSVPHVNYIWLYTATTAKLTGLYIYNNKIYNVGTSYGSSGAIHLEITSNGSGGFIDTRIYNNVLQNIDYPVAIYLTFYGTGAYDGLKILNNTIHQPASDCDYFTGSCGGIGLLGSGENRYYNDIDIRNNILSIRGSGATAISVDGSMLQGSLDIDYNLYYLAGSNPFECNGSNMSWPDFKSCIGESESNSIGTNTDPLFVSVASNNLFITSTSPAYNTGINLSSIFSTDILNNTRYGSWDIGAYEFNGYSGRTLGGLTVGGMVLQ